MTRRRHGLGHRIGQWCCWGIGVETLGGLAYYAARAGSYLTVVLVVALAVVSRVDAYLKRRRR